MIVETLTILTMLVGGSTLLRIAGLRGWALPVLGATTGLALYISVGAVQVFTPISTSPIITMVVAGAVPTLVWLWLLFRGKDVRIRVLPALAVVVGTVALVAALRPLRLTNWTSDSLRYVTNGSLLASNHFDQATTDLVTKRLIGVPLIHAPGNLSGEYYLASISPLIAGLVVALVAWFAWTLLSTRLSRWVAVGVIATGLLLLVSINRFVFNAFYLNGHLLFGLLLLALVGCSWLLAIDAKVSRNALLLVISLSIVAIVVTRAEGSILVGLALLPMLLATSTPFRFRWIPLAAFGATTIAWQTFVAFVYLGEGEKIPFSVTGLLLAGVAVLIAIPVLRWAPVVKHGRAVLLLAEAGLWLLLLVLIVRDPDVFVASVSATVQNVVFGEGSWGASLVVLMVLLLVIAAFVRVPGETTLRFPLTSFIPFAFLLAYLRGIAFRVGDGDSLNRMWIQLIPIAVLYLIVAIGAGERRWGRTATAKDAVLDAPV